MVRASDEERFYQCLTCLHIESCRKMKEGCVDNIVLIKILKKITEQFKKHFLC